MAFLLIQTAAALPSVGDHVKVVMSDGSDFEGNITAQDENFLDLQVVSSFRYAWLTGNSSREPQYNFTILTLGKGQIGVITPTEWP